MFRSSLPRPGPRPPAAWLPCAAPRPAGRLPVVPVLATPEPARALLPANLDGLRAPLTPKE